MTSTQSNVYAAYDGVKFVDPLYTAASGRDMRTSFTSTLTGNQRTFRRLSLARGMEINPGYPTSVTLDRVVAPVNGIWTPNNGTAWLACTNCFIKTDGDDIDVSLRGDLTDCFIFCDKLASGTGTMHGFSLTLAGTTIGGCVFDAILDDFGQGDIIMGGSSGATGTYTINNNVFLPMHYGQAIGVAISMLGNKNLTISADHNTFIGELSDPDNVGILRMGETEPGRTNQVASLKSNLCYAFGVSGRKTNIYSDATWRAVTGATKANPCVITATSHNYATGSKVRIVDVVGMTELNGNVYTITIVNTNSFSLDGTDSTAYGTYTSGGRAGVIDHCLPANMSHNGGYNLLAGQGGESNPGFIHFAYPAIGAFSDPAAANLNRVIADPQFVDCSTAGWRCLMTFDIDYLGHAAGTAWNNSTSYAIGDIASYSNASLWMGKTVNVRCIKAHSSATASTAPGTGTDWGAYWEPAGEYYIRDLAADTTIAYTPGVPQATVQDLLAWVKGGVAPTNPAFRDAGHDGLTIGAVEGEFAAAWPVSAAGTATFGQSAAGSVVAGGGGAGGGSLFGARVFGSRTIHRA
jgi:hypothetical protein